MSQQYEVKFVGDDRLPAGTDWAFVTNEVGAVLFVRGSAVSGRLFSECWQVWQNYLEKERAAGSR